MDDYSPYLEEDFIIYNSALGLKDFVTIDRIEKISGITYAWLDEPYEMVRFSLEDLLLVGEISFEQCLVLTKQRWQEQEITLQRNSYMKQRLAQEQFYEEIKNYNMKKQQNPHNLNEKEYRKILSLPVEGKLEESQIKTAYRIVAKKTHPDVGGCHEEFIYITEAKDCLLSICEF